MTEQRIAEDLREEYRIWTTSKNARPTAEAYVALIERLSKAEEQLRAMQWKPITPENLPKVGDEVWGQGRKVSPVEDVHIAMLGADARAWIQNRFTHFRPIAPPAQEVKP
jgi:hypothetical protein